MTSRIWGRSEIQDSYSCDFSSSQALACVICLVLSVLPAGWLQLSSPHLLLSLPRASLSSAAFCLLQAGLGRSPWVLLRSCSYLAHCFVMYLIASPPPPSPLAVSPRRAAPGTGIKVCCVSSTCQTSHQTCLIHYLNKSLQLFLVREILLSLFYGWVNGGLEILSSLPKAIY